MLMYPIAYMLIWALPTSIRIYQAVTAKPAPFPLQTVDKACIVVQGLVDAIIYGANESSVSSWRALLFPESFPTLTAVGASPTAMREGGVATADKKRPPRVPPARLSDLDDDSASSFHVALSPAATRHPDDAAAAAAASWHGGGTSSGWESDGREDVEMHPLPSAKRGSGSGITKTVEVNVSREAADPVRFPPPVRRFSKTKEGSSFLEG